MTERELPGGDRMDEGWARETLGRLAQAAVTEQRRARRWGIFFKLLGFGYLTVLLVLAFAGPWGGDSPLGPHAARVSVAGVIAVSEEASADNIILGLREAFEGEQVSGIILDINSPGGSPVQAGQVYDEIRRLKEEYPQMPVYAVIGDVGASGGYYIAAAADEIYANRASIVGSIGVRADNFGFTQAMEKLGVERRLYTAGENKGFLDPFLPEDPRDVAHLQALLNDIHGQFIAAVRQGRGERLKESPELYSGLVWTGEYARDLGLVDGLADVRQVAEDKLEVEDVVDYSYRPPVFEQLLGQVETALSGVVVKALEGGLELR